MFLSHHTLFQFIYQYRKHSLCLQLSRSVNVLECNFRLYYFHLTISFFSSNLIFGLIQARCDASGSLLLFHQRWHIFVSVRLAWLLNSSLCTIESEELHLLQQYLFLWVVSWTWSCLHSSLYSRCSCLLILSKVLLECLLKGFGQQPLLRTSLYHFRSQKCANGSCSFHFTSFCLMFYHRLLSYLQVHTFWQKLQSFF